LSAALYVRAPIVRQIFRSNISNALSVSVVCAVRVAGVTAQETAETIQTRERLIARTYPATRERLMPFP
jgi:hypothetical protein